MIAPLLAALAIAAPCHIQGTGLLTSPDPVCTPGAYHHLTHAEVCTPKTRPTLPAAVRRRILARYGLTAWSGAMACRTQGARGREERMKVASHAAAMAALDEMDYRNQNGRIHDAEQVRAVLDVAFPIMLRDFLWSDEARDVTGSWGHDNTSGDEFRNQLMGALLSEAGR